ncbi:hypothetical protein BDZ45DRAFT_811297 [Acephala macrosclerotiorum]|nr:hypothetical protein BDZ45DRAFT_811297 [Acephala macrosclerotiorum]
MSSSSSKKRKSCHSCGCDTKHASELEQETKLKRHRAVAANVHKIAIFSPTIPIFVGAKKQVLYAQKNLLTLHSGYFKDLFANQDGGEEGGKIILPSVSPLCFADFVAWLSTGTPLPLNLLNPGRASCWELGNFLRAPAYQNMCMQRSRNWAMSQGVIWPEAKVVQVIFETCGKGTKIRKFAAHSVAYKKPFEKFEEGSQECLEWNELLQKLPDLAVEIAKVAGKDWFGQTPWDDPYWGAYLEEEVDLDSEWDKQILLSRSLEDIREAATKERCAESRIELDHLERKKPNDKS